MPRPLMSAALPFPGEFLPSAGSPSYYTVIQSQHDAKYAKYRCDTLNIGVVREFHGDRK